MNYFLYILKSDSSDKFYTGISNNPQNRLYYHNSIETGFTARYRPWKVVFTKEFPDKTSAHSAELKVKSWKSKIMIEHLIAGNIVL